MPRGKRSEFDRRRRVGRDAPRYVNRDAEDNTPSYDSAEGPRDMTRRPLPNEWERDDLPFPPEEDK